MIDRISFHDQIQRNKAKSVLLIGIVFIVLLLLGYVISLAFDPGYFFFIMIISIIFSISYIIFGYYNSDKVALASVGAKKANPSEHRQLYNSVEGLTIASGMPMPQIYVMQSEQINAFATGRDPQHSVICVTTGALKKLNKQELEGVLGHELSHIANFDIRFMTLTAILIGMIAIISQIFLRGLWYGRSDERGKGNAILMLVAIALAILAPILTQLVQFAISRKREYAADASSVKFTRYPTGLIKALEKIKNEHAPENPKRINKAVAPLFMSDPFRKKFSELFSTHPDVNKRIKILERM
ncbi:M48 family metallopeptidase [Candidatus Pacearchaeota archaeon]|nr:M48 family metallopeptidase [Candidatus Pacearchaeota archaeon]